MAGDTLWEKLLDNPEEVPWEEKYNYLRPYFNDSELALIQSAHDSGTHGVFERDILDIYNLDADSWTHRTIDMHWAFWLVSGNRSYVRNMKYSGAFPDGVEDDARWTVACIEMLIGKHV